MLLNTRQKSPTLTLIFFSKFEFFSVYINKYFHYINAKTELLLNSIILQKFIFFDYTSCN